MRSIGGHRSMRTGKRQSWHRSDRRIPGATGCFGVLKIAGACILLFAGGAAAIAAGVQQPVESLNSTPGAGASFLRMIGALIFVIALFLFGVWFFQNYSRLLGKPGKTGRLHIVEGRSLGNRQAVYVVGYDRQRWLIGATATTISLIGALPEASEDSVSSTPAPAHFISVLQQVLSRKP